MIADALALEVHAHARRTLADNPVLRKARVGKVAPDVVARYLASLAFLLRETQDHFRRARDRARACGDLSLARHYDRKIVEERGHDRWAAADLRFLVGLEAAEHFVPVAAIEALAKANAALVEHDPADYLAYVLWAEQFTVLVGGVFIQELVVRCGVDPSALTCLSRHVELDADHADEGLEAIDRLVEDPARLEPMRQVILRTAALFDRACEQMLQPSVPAEAWTQAAVG